MALPNLATYEHMQLASRRWCLSRANPYAAALRHRGVSRGDPSTRLLPNGLEQGLAPDGADGLRRARIAYPAAWTTLNNTIQHEPQVITDQKDGACRKRQVGVLPGVPTKPPMNTGASSPSHHRCDTGNAGVFCTAGCQHRSSGSTISHSSDDQPKSDAPMPFPVRAS